MRIEKVNRAFPSETGCSLVVARRCIVVKAVVRTFVDVSRVFRLGCLQCCFIRWPTAVNSGVEFAVMEQERRFESAFSNYGIRDSADDFDGSTSPTIS